MWATETATLIGPALGAGVYALLLAGSVLGAPATTPAVTEADIEHRIVKELNAEPAALEYSRAVGLSESNLELFSFAAHPVLVRVGGAYYARSIQRTNPDGSLQFFCAIETPNELFARRLCMRMLRVHSSIELASDERCAPNSN